MIARGRVVILIVLAAVMQAGFAPSAHALFGHKKKNTSPYAYLAPKKQKKSKNWYRNSLTGEMVYGKPPQQHKKKK